MKLRILRMQTSSVMPNTSLLVAIEEVRGPITRLVDELEFEVPGIYKGYSPQLQYAAEQVLVDTGYTIDRSPEPTEPADLDVPMALAVPPTVNL